MNAQHTPTVDDTAEYEDTPKGLYDYYSDELNASIKMTSRWHKKADKIVNRYLGKSTGSSVDGTIAGKGDMFELNLFHSNIQTVGSMLYGNLPKIDVSRRYADSSDDVGRVAAETMERLLNLDVQQNGEELDAVLRSALFDRLVVGLGCGRVRYEVETEQVAVEGMTDDKGDPVMEERLVSESAPIDYYFWGDVLWGWARNFADVPWVAFRNYLTKEEIQSRFPDADAEDLTYKTQQMASGDESLKNPDTDGPKMKAEVWELWDKEKRKVCWISLGYEKLLDAKPDPLQLRQFFPCPPFFLANSTTSLYMPTPDFCLSEDLYNQIDILQTRISILTSAVKAVGAYDAGSPEIPRIMKEGFENDLIPVENWALMSEKGGLKATIEWLPIDAIVNALDKLRQLLSETIGLLQQVTGMSDIMRGDLSNQYEGVGQTNMKAKFGSVRVQALQDQFATFASNIMQIKAEIISRHFSPETIARQSNMQHSPDVDLLPQAIELIKTPDSALLRIDIRPESVAMVDYGQMKEERTGYLNALSTFMQSASPLMESDPATKPFLLEMLQWGLAGFKGSQEIEGVMDRAIEASKEEADNPKADPAEQAQQQAEQMEKMKAQIALQAIQAKAAADQALREQDRAADIETAQATSNNKLAEIQATIQAKLAEIQAKAESDMLVEQVTSQANIAQAQAGANSEIQKDAINMELEVEKAMVQTELKIAEISASSAAKIKEAKAKPTPTPKDSST